MWRVFPGELGVARGSVELPAHFLDSHPWDDGSGFPLQSSANYLGSQKSPSQIPKPAVMQEFPGMPPRTLKLKQ